MSGFSIQSNESMGWSSVDNGTESLTSMAEDDVQVQNKPLQNDAIDDSNSVSSLKDLQQAVKTDYTSPVYAPTLSPPTNNVDIQAVIAQVISEKQAAGDTTIPFAHLIPPVPQPTPDAQYPAVFENLLETEMDPLTEAQVNQQANEMGVEPRQVVAMIKFAHYNPNNAQVDPAIRNLATQIESVAKTQVEKQFGLTEPFEPKDVGSEFNYYMTSLQEKGVEAQAKKLAGSPEEMQMILFGFYHPEVVGKMDPAIQAKVQALIGTMQSIMAEEVGTPKGTLFPVNPRENDNAVGYAYDQAFENGLRSLKGFSSSEIRQLKTMHYLPDGDYSQASPKLLSKFEALQNAAQLAIQKKFGVPGDFSASPASNNYNAVVNGEYQDAIEEGINKYPYPLSKDELAQLKAYAQDPSVEISESLKGVMYQIQTQAAYDVKAKLGLPDDWQPPSLQELSLSFNNQAQKTRNIHKHLSEVHETAKGLAKYMNPSGQVIYADFLKVVSEALNALKDMIYHVMSVESNLTRSQERAQLEAATTKLNMQKEQIQQQLEQAEKAQSMKILNTLIAVFAPFVMFVMAIITVTCNAISGNDGPSFKEAFFGGLKTMIDMIKALVMLCTIFLPKSVGEAINALIDIYILVILTIAMAILSMIPGVDQLCDRMLNDSGLYDNIIKGFGGSDEDVATFKQIWGYVSMAISFIATAIMMCIPGLQAVALAAIMAAIARIVALVVRIATIVLKAATMALRVASAAIQTVVKAVGMASRALAAAAQGAAKAETIMGRVMNAVASFLKGVARIAGKIAQGIEKMTEEFIKLCRRFVDQMIKIGREFMNQAKKAEKLWDEMVEYITKEFEKLISTVGKYMSKAAGKAGEEMKNLFNMAKEAAGGTTKKMGEMGDDAAEAAKDANSFMARAEAKATDMVDSVKSFFKRLDDYRMDLSDSITDSAVKRGWFTDEELGVVRKAATVKSEAKEAVDSATGTVQKVDDQIDTFETVGKDIKKTMEKGEIDREATQAKQMEKFGDFLVYMNYVSTGVQVITGIQDMLNNLEQAERILRLARLEAAIQELDAIIKIIKKGIENLLDQLTSLGQWAASITQMQQANWANLSMAMSKLANTS